MSGARNNLTSSSMFASEKEVMELWDAGMSIEAIALQTGKLSSYVRTIVSRFKVTSYNPQDEMVRRGSEALLAAIRLHHPEAVTGGRP